MTERDPLEELADDMHGVVPASPTKFLADLGAAAADEPHWAKVLICTSPMFPGYGTAAYRGFVSGRVVLGQGFWKNFKMALGSDSFGKRSATLESDFAAMETECLKQLQRAAFSKRANAVVNVSLQFGETSGEANLFYAVATGTAVFVE